MVLVREPGCLCDPCLTDHSIAKVHRAEVTAGPLKNTVVALNIGRFVPQAIPHPVLRHEACALILLRGEYLGSCELNYSHGFNRECGYSGRIRLGSIAVL